MIAVPNPLRIACTECHRDMRVEFQSHETHDDTVVVAAECDCGRIIGVIDGLLIQQLVRDGRPLIAAGIQHDPALGDLAKERLAALRGRMAVYERWIGAATWAHEKPRAPAMIATCASCHNTGAVDERYCIGDEVRWNPGWNPDHSWADGKVCGIDLQAERVHIRVQRVSKEWFAAPASPFAGGMCTAPMAEVEVRPAQAPVGKRADR